MVVSYLVSYLKHATITTMAIILIIGKPNDCGLENKTLKVVLHIGLNVFLSHAETM